MDDVVDRLSGAEATDVNTRILRLALGVEESRAYWEHIDPCVPRARRPELAFEQRWFGAKSLERIRFLLASFRDRYDAFPEALAVLRRWRTMDAVTRPLVCHWHLQLSDPMYRAFTGQYLLERRNHGNGEIDRDAVGRWVEREYQGRWSASTTTQFASKLLSAAYEAGLVSRAPDPRNLTFPRVTDLALGYVLHLLRHVAFEGTMIDNPYLRSVGLAPDALGRRLLAIPGIVLGRVGDVAEIEWTSPSLSTWAAAAL